jgi:hypothetical protein
LGSGQAYANFGQLGVSGDAHTAASGDPTASYAGGSGQGFVESVAEMSDTILFDTDRSGDSLTFTFLLTGSTDVLLDGQSETGGAAIALFDNHGTLITDIAGSSSYTIPITGSSVSFGFRLQGDAGCGVSLVAGSLCGAEFDYIHTATITGLSFVDANGDPLPVTFTAQSGFSYPTGSPTAAVPEPTTLCLMALGLAGLATRARRGSVVPVARRTATVHGLRVD